MRPDRAKGNIPALRFKSGTAAPVIGFLFLAHFVFRHIAFGYAVALGCRSVVGGLLVSVD
jgi:hypothetical protein